jgi:ribosomal protein L11 methylase PrmA
MQDAQAIRFDFGENWGAFAQRVTEDHIAEAERGLRKLFPNQELKGASFLDVGCGSGLSMLAALRLGAAEVRGIDPDYRCLSATRYLLSKFAAKSRWNLEAKSILDFSEPHDVTYCWGVLHHTGAM